MSSAPAVRRIGLFGGSFDPVHNAHLALARAAQGQLALDELRWVPAGQPWQKGALTDAVHRAAMLRLAIAGERGQVLEACELERAGPTYTIDTVRELQAREPGAQWLLVIGRDQFAKLQSWHEWQELLTRVILAVAGRPGATDDAALPPLPHETIRLPPMQVSSTTIRQRLDAGQGIDDLVPPAVAGYIARHHLYQGTLRS